MKEAKNKFDGLIERIKLGETVQFGQMEGLFAKALLGRFLEQLRSPDFRKRAEQLHKERILAQEDVDEDTEIPELSDRELVSYELDQARTAIGALGVRPELKQMQPYVEKAINQRDWRLLNTVVSLTEEGKLQKGTLENIVLNSLLTRPTREEGDTPSTVKAEFGEPHYTRELVEPVYVRALTEGNIEGVKAVQDETKIAISPTLVQTAYENLVEHGFSRNMKRLAEITGSKPEKTSALRVNLIRLAETQDIIQKETLDELDTVLDLKNDIPLVKGLQVAAIRGGKVATFFNIYNNVGPRARAPISNVHDAYDKLASVDAMETIVGQAIQTGIAPRRETLTKAYSYLLEVKNFGRIEELAEKTSITPRFDDEVVDATVRNLVGSEGRHTPASVQLRDSLEPFVKFANLIHQAGSTIAEEHVERACQVYLESYVAGEEDRGLEGRIGVVNGLYTKLGIDPSEKITALKLERRLKELGVTLRELVHKHTKEGWNLSPLQPTKGTNMNEWRQYSTAARTAVRKHIRDLQTLHESHPACSVDQHLQKTETDSGFIQDTYTACLETFLTQCAMDEKTVDLPQLMQTVGMPMDETAVNRALINHIKRNRGSEDARKVLENAQKAGISIALNDKQIDKIGQGVLGYSDGFLHYLDLHYLKDLIGERAFPPSLQEVVQGRSMAMLGSGHIKGYDELQSLLSIKRPLTAWDAQTIRSKVISLLTDGREEALEALHREQAEAIRDRAGIILTATPDELEIMVDKYFEGGSNAEHPNHIARFFNAQLNPDQIRKRYEALLKDESIKGFGLITYNYTERIKAVQRLMDDTGIKYEPKDLQQRIEAEVNGNDTGAWPRWGPLLGLLTTHNVPPEQSTATRIYQASIQALLKLEDISWLSTNEQHLLKIVRRLRELNLPVEDAVAIKVKDLGLKSYGDHNEPYGYRNRRLITFMDLLNNNYGRADVLTPTEITTVADAIDKDFTGKNIGVHNRNADLLKDLSFIYTKGNRQPQANERATLLYTEYKEGSEFLNGRFPLYAYCVLTGARPTIQGPELAALKTEIEDARIQRTAFTLEQKAHFLKMINGWIGAAA